MLCLAFDVAKGKSVVGLFNSDMNALISPFEIMHSKTEFENLMKRIDPENTIVILESTSIYHYPLVTFFESINMEIIVLNPLVAKDFKKNLRKTKTDKLDCENLASVYFSGRFNVQRKHSHDYLQLQNISRHIYHLNECLTRHKNRYHQLLELVFPQFEYNLKNDTVFKENMLNLIKEYPHPDFIINNRVDRIANVLKYNSNKTYKYFIKYATRYKLLSGGSLTAVKSSDVICEHLSELALIIINLQNDIQASKEKLIRLAKTVNNDFEIYHSIKGIGEYTAASLMAELKNVRQFSNVKKLTASCGLDPTIIQSGKSINYHGPISKRGNKHSRKILFNSVVNIVVLSSRLYHDHPILSYYRKKRNEGKHHYASVIACTTKLLRIIFTLIKNNQLFT